MKSYIKYIGVIDKSDKVHCVKFTKGVNIITGKSSTGKSAMIEIFDYCFGSSEFTVPSGIITDNSELYFVVLSVQDTNIIIARIHGKTKAFFNEESELPNINNLTISYFKEELFIPLPDFRRLIGKYYGLDIEDTDTDLEDKEYRGKAKGRPSIRHMTSFMLQHQNLIANKHSIFYRFDEKEKREQTIEQFKIFAGFVNQEYFITKQKLSEEERNLRKLENKQISISELQELNVSLLENLLKEFLAITGNQLFTDNPTMLLLSPKLTLEKLLNIKIESDYESNESLNQLKELKDFRNGSYAKKRTLLVKLNDINTSIKYANDYKTHLNNLDNETTVKIHLSECPFCKTLNDNISKDTNELVNAIDWLNKELSKTPYMLGSFEAEQKKIEEEVKTIDSEISDTNDKIFKLDEITKNLGNNKDLEEQGLKIKLKVENFLENIINRNITAIDESIAKIKNEITRLEKLLKDNFNVTQQIKIAETYINKSMKKIGTNFEFEDSYQPINLKFSLDSFDLWHEKTTKDKIFLRSMGSGANWLYSHLTLFMALHKYFCSLGNKSLLPPVLFLDQPSQVYFPTAIKDEEDKFDAKKIEEKKGTGSADEDLNAVTNLFNQLVTFCKETLDETGIEPQVIITDHADNLQLANDVDFENLVNGRRWRKRGFISISE